MSVSLSTYSNRYVQIPLADNVDLPENKRSSSERCLSRDRSTAKTSRMLQRFGHTRRNIPGFETHAVVTGEKDIGNFITSG